jgi:hypothetical protein
MMKKDIAILLLIALSYSNLCAQTDSGKSSVKPTNFVQEVTLNVEGKPLKYYFLDSQKDAEISIKGPGKLKIISRCQFLPSSKEKLDYEIVYAIDGGANQSLKFKGIKRSDKATFLNGTLGVPGQNRESEIDLGRGNHTLSFRLKENSPGVAVRYVFTPTKEKRREWIEFFSAKSAEIVELIANESPVSYYRFSSENPLTVEVIGPTELRVFTRVEFKYNMRGVVNYRIQVKNGNKIINTYQLQGKRSEVTTYKKEKDIIPSKASEFIINVPEGKQVYEFIPLDKDKNTILARFMLPKKDVKGKK